MANTSISGLTAGAAVSATDIFPNVQTVDVGPLKTTAAQLKTFMSASPTLVTPTLLTPTLGAADAAAPVAQTLGVQSVVAGTANTAGANFTIRGSAGTGSAAGGSILFQIAPLGGAGSAQNAFATALTIAGSGAITTSSSITAGSSIVATLSMTVGIGQSFVLQSRGKIDASGDGIVRIANNAQTDFGRLQFGGTSSSFPALKRSTTSLQAVLADDSGFTAIQGKLTTDTAYTAGAAGAATGYITIYDSTGTAYKVEARV